MSKTAEFMKLLGVLLLCLVILGTIGYFIPKIATLSSTPKTQSESFEKSSKTHQNTPLTPVESDELRLADEIKATLEKITGPHTVRATVRLQMVKQDDTIKKNTLLPDTAVVKEIVSSQQPDARFLGDATTQKTVYDFSSETHTSQSQYDEIKKQSITVIVDGYLAQTPSGGSVYQPRSKTEMATYSALVQSLVGFDAQRGDTLQLVNLPFITEPANTIFGFDRTLFVQSVLLTLFFILCILVIIKFIIPMIYMLLQPAPITYLPPQNRPQNMPSDQIVGDLSTSKSNAVRHIFTYSPDLALTLIKNWLYQEPVTTDPLSGTQKVAVLLLAMGEDTTKAIFLKLKSDNVTAISREMAGLGRIKADVVSHVFSDFLAASAGEADISGTPTYVSQLLEATLPQDKAKAILDEVNMPVEGKTIWQKLEHIDTALLAEQLSTEYPQTIAVILYHLSNDKSSGILNYFPESLTMDVLMRLSALQSIDETTLAQVEKGLEEQIQNLFSYTGKKSGKEKAADIISLMDKKIDVLNTLYERSPDMAGQISSDVILFENIASWDNKSIQTLLEKADRQTIVCALKGASDAIKEAFSKNMSPAIWSGILKETNKLSSVKLKEIDDAQHQLIKTAQELIEQKKINVHTVKR